jgi:ribosomal protein S12 methylthiotransferase
LKKESSVCIITLGCPKNVVEGEQIAGLLHDAGLRLTTDIGAADYALVHTCSFIADARAESENVIRQLLRLRQSGWLKKLLVSGCLVQADGKEVQRLYPEIDGFIGTGELHRIGELFNDGTPPFIVGKPGGLLESPSPRLLSSSLPSAYLRLSEGCNHRCSFCIIPQLRGKYRSRKKGTVLAEASSLAAQGIEELILIAQDTSCYGKDLYGRFALADLLRKLSAIDGVRWLRLMYAYPGTVNRQLIETIKREPKVCKYIDIPLQHASDRVLKSMRRGSGTRQVVEQLKNRIPGLALRSSFIVGFPGETDKEFEELARFVEEGWFEHAGVFEYSAYPGTAAAGFPDQVPETIKRERRRQLMLIQKKVVNRNNRRRVGSIEEVLTEGKTPEGRCAGRASFQAPEIDSKVLFSGVARPGEFTTVKITGVKGYDLVGEKI